MYLVRSIALAASLFGLAMPALAQEAIRIGVYCPFTGGSADMGIAARNGIRLAIEEINTMAGGVNGRKIELVERDDQANPELAKQLIDDMIRKDKVVAALGVCNTGVGLATIDLFQNAKVPLIVPVSTGTPLTKKFAGAPENWIFRVSPRDEVQAPFIVADALKRGFRKVALFADTTGYGEAGKNDVEKALAEAGLKPVSVQRFAVGAAGRKQVAFSAEGITEMTAGAKGANFMFPMARTVVDVGAEEGRGMKTDAEGKAIDFAGNEKCAAGAGSFAEAMSRALQMTLKEFGDASLKSDKSIPMNAQ